jgi:hypothetical protein
MELRITGLFKSSAATDERRLTTGTPYSFRSDSVCLNCSSTKDIPCMFADFRNQVQENNFLLEVIQRTGGINVFGIDLAVSIMDGDDLSEHRRKELALARLMAETIGVILYTGESDVDVRTDAAKDMIREFKHVYPGAMNV